MKNLKYTLLTLVFGIGIFNPISSEAQSTIFLEDFEDCTIGGVTVNATINCGWKHVRNFVCTGACYYAVPGISSSPDDDTAGCWIDGQSMVTFGGLVCNYGVNVSGFYRFEQRAEIFDLTEYIDVFVEFDYVSMGEPAADYGEFEYSYDGTNWTPIGPPLQGSPNITRNHVIDLKTVADGQSEFWIAFKWYQDLAVSVPPGLSVDNLELKGTFVGPDFESKTLVCTGNPVQMTDLSTASPTSWNWSTNPSAGVVISDPAAPNPTITFNTPGTYAVSLDIVGVAGAQTETKTAYIKAQDDISLPFIENFNSGIPTAWTVINPDGQITWGPKGATNIDGNLSQAAAVNGFNYGSGAGQSEFLISPPMDFSVYDSAFLSFEHAYAGDAVNAPFFDSLEVQISTDCGDSWASLIKFVEDLTGSYATAPPTANALFVPNDPSLWCGNGSFGPDCTNRFDLTPYVGNENVRVQFIWYTAPSNDGYIDNILIEGVSNDVAAAFSAEPQPACVNSDVQYSDESAGNVVTWNWVFPGGVPATSTDENPVVTYAAPGLYDVQLTVCDGGGNCSTEQRTEFMEVLQSVSLPFTENWEGGNFSDNSWTVGNADQDITWEVVNVGGDQQGVRAAYMNHFAYGVVGQEDMLTTPPLDLSGYDEVFLSFDHAYAVDQLMPVNDQLIVQVTSDCGVTWIDMLDMKDGGPAQYSTTTTLNSEFTPGSEADWCFGSTTDCYQVDMSSFIGMNGVRVRFVAVNANGNNAYIDNIVIQGSGAGSPQADFVASSTLTCPGKDIQFTDLTTGGPTMWEWEFTGGVPSTSTDQHPLVNYPFNGVYAVRLTASNGSGTSIETKSSYIRVVNGFALPIVEGFETDETFGNRGWSIDNPDGDQTFEIVTTGGTSPGDKSLKMDLFNNTNVGSRDILISPPMDFSNWDSISFSFEHAYQPGVLSSPDSLIVQISNDCGGTWSSLVEYYHTGGGTFGTTASGFNEFTPSQESDWCISGNANTPCSAFDLSSYIGQKGMLVRFIVANGNGNNIFLDNINISGFYIGREPEAAFESEYPVACVGEAVQFFDKSTNFPDEWKWTFNGGTPASSTDQNPLIAFDAPGLYSVALIATNFFGTDTTFVQDFIKVVEPSLLPFTESFENGDLGIQNWYTKNPDGGIKWKIDSASGNGGALAAMVDHRAYFAPLATRDYLVTKPFDLRAYDSVFFSFEHAYQVFSTNSIDSLTLSYSTDCGTDWTRIVTFGDDGNGSYATTLPSQNAFRPMVADDWCISGPYGSGCIDLDLTGIVNGFDDVKFRFEAYNENGNNQYIDNINITGVSSLPIADFTSNIQVVCQNDSVLFENLSSVNATDFVWYFEGGSIDSVFQRDPGYIRYDTVGVYEVNLRVSNPFGSDYKEETTFIQVVAAPAFDFTVVPAGCGQSNGSATVNITGGVGPFSYVWNRLPGDTLGTLSNAVGGLYHVVVTGSNGCVTESDVLINTNGSMQASIISYQGVTCNGDMDGRLEAKGSHGLAPYTYEWNTGATSALIENLSGGSYTCIIKDAAGCVQSVTSQVTEPGLLQLSMSATDDDGSTNGTASSQVTGGTAPYVYAWSTGDSIANLDSLTQGLYSLTVTDAHGCSISGQVIITYNPEMDIILDYKTNVSCNGLNDGEIQVSVEGGTAPYNFQWNTSPPQFTAKATGLGVGNYTVTVIDNLGVTGTMTYFVSEEAPIVLNASATDDDGTQSGTAAASIFSGGIAPYTYSWSTNPVQTTATIANLQEGFYTVTVTDSVGCTASQTVQVVGTYAPLDVNQQGINHVTCFGDNDGSIQSIASGGVPPYQYSWSTTPTQFGQTATNLVGGTYTCYVVDAYQNIDSVTVTVNQPQELLCLMSSTDDQGTGNGTATVVGTGGTPFPGNTYQYQWNTVPQQLTATAIGLVYGFYTVIVTDKEGCTCTGTVEVEGNVGIEEELAKRITLYPNPNDGMFNVRVDLSYATDVKLQVTNALGEVVMYKQYNNLSKKDLSLDLSNQPKGMYNLRLIGESWEHSTRFIISR